MVRGCFPLISCHSQPLHRPSLICTREFSGINLSCSQKADWIKNKPQLICSPQINSVCSPFSSKNVPSLLYDHHLTTFLQLLALACLRQHELTQSRSGSSMRNPAHNLVPAHPACKKVLMCFTAYLQDSWAGGTELGLADQALWILLLNAK